jgi:hypothetical protein
MMMVEEENVKKNEINGQGDRIQKEEEEKKKGSRLKVR